MRILIVTDVFPNEINPNFGTFTLERLKCLKQLAEVEVVAPVPFFPSWSIFKFFQRWHNLSRISRYDTVEGIKVHHPRRIVIPKIGGFTNGIFYLTSLSKQLKKVAREFPFDVIDAHFLWPDGYAALKVGKSMDVPVCITAHGTDVNLMPKFPTIRPFITWTAKNAQRIVAVSKALADIVIELGAHESRVKVIHNGVDINKFKRIDKTKARKELGLNEKDIILISIGALIPRKGHEFLIDGIKMLIENEGLDKIKLLIVGDGELKTYLVSKIESNGLQNNVRLIGAVPHDELYKWLSASDFFCLTSSREGWPTVFFEAWACGVPVLATSVHGAPEAICSDKFGLLIDKQDPLLIAQTIKKAIEMKWDPEEMMLYASNNSWDKMVERMYEELQTIVEEHKKVKRREE